VTEKTKIDPWLERIVPIAIVAIPVLVLAKITISAVHKKVGHPGATLDDAYIHFQYARAIAEGHPMRYHAGDPPTTGATSLLWPLVLAPFWAIGFRGDLLMWPAWLISFAALGALAWEARALAEPLSGRACATAAGAMVICFSAFTWMAASGMEVVPFAWALARAVRRGSEWAEGQRSSRRRWELIALGFIATLLRPEGAIVAIGIAIVLALRCQKRERAWGALAALGAFVPQIISYVSTGSLRSTTAQVKLLWGNPYYAGSAFFGEVGKNLRVLFGTLLDGEVWSAEFVPTNMAPIFCLGIACVVVQAFRTKKAWRAGGVLLLAAMMLIPATYVTFLWNRLRYLWPFTTGWLVGIACLARCIGDFLAQLGPKYRIAGPIAAGAACGAFAQHLPFAIDDVAASASGISRQQAELGRWARDHLPKDARIGVNDAGAIAYFGERPTFDIVGLTTRGEGRYWVAGAGSRLEHYERMRRETPSALPTHFIVYPEWMGCDAVLGEILHEAVVTDASILGGQIMRVYVADYSLLGSGELPWTDAPSSLIDALDVADLESEAEHHYELLGAVDNSEVAKTSVAPSGKITVDGGRGWRTMDRFVADVAALVIARVESDAPVTLTLSIDGDRVGERSIEGGSWTEVSFDVPPAKAKRGALVELRASGWITSYHYWFFTASRPG
jgi:hypothetical protein